MKVEIEKRTPLAVIYGSGDLPSGLSNALKKQHLRVLLLEKTDDALSVLENPAYVFFFVMGDISLSVLRSQFEDALTSAARSGAKAIIILDRVNEAYEKTIYEIRDKHGWPVVIVETRGKMDGPSGPTTVSNVGKLVRLAFSSHTNQKQILVGKETPLDAKIVTDPIKKMSIQDVYNKIHIVEKKKPFNIKKFISKSAILISLLLLLSSLFLLVFPLLQAAYHLNSAKNALLTGKFKEAEISSLNARTNLISAKQVALFFGPLSEKYFDFIILGEAATDLLTRTAKIAPKADQLAKNISLGQQDNIVLLTSQLHQEFKPIKEDLAIIDAQAKNLQLKHKYLEQIPTISSYLSKADSLLSVITDIIPPSEKRTYLLVFQNSTELRPTGGFIGSYGLINFDNGKLTNWQIYDIYSADGQLKGQINPPDELLHFFNQTSWYMRDSNWAPDFPVTARRLLWFLEKETGQKADGVIAVNLGAAQKILKAIGPVELADFSQTISSADFFQKAEYTAEINFFAGSTQKKDFLGASARAMLAKITGDGDKNLPALGQAIAQALEEKDIMFYLENTTAQKAIMDSNWGGYLGSLPNSLMLVEANLGLNKANYFVTREIGVASTIDKSGNVDSVVTVIYHNASPSDAWPGGNYKNYLRFLVPVGSIVNGFDIGDSRTPVVSPVLSADQLAKIGKDQFFVFQTEENHNFASYGTLVEIPLNSSLKVTFKYRTPNKIIFGPKATYVFNFIKQPGMGTDPLDITLEYPNFLVPYNTDSLGNLLPLAFPSKLIYNSDTSVDRSFRMNFVSKL